MVLNASVVQVCAMNAMVKIPISTLLFGFNDIACVYKVKDRSKIVTSCMSCLFIWV